MKKTKGGVDVCGTCYASARVCGWERDRAMTTRRTFIKGAAAGGAAVAAASRFEPLQSLTDALASDTPVKLVEDHVPTTCWIGKQDCGILARRINGRVIKFEGHPDHPRNLGELCPKGVAEISVLYDPNRLKTPLARTNEKGVTGKWREISWDEAMDTVAKKFKELHAKDPELILWQVGRSKAEAFYDTALIDSSGIKRIENGVFCDLAGEVASVYTLGPEGGMQPDFHHTRYLLSWGWNLTGAGGNKLCWITHPRQLLEAKERGLKVVSIDPRLRASATHADRWLSIRPGTDLALALALCNGLIKRGTLDKDYLTKYTNAPYLVRGDGTFLRVGGKEQVWDSASGAARPAGSKGVRPALDGSHVVNGKKLKTAFQVFKEHVAKNTPEWAAEVCGVNADEIKEIVKDLSENAMIGETIKVDGVRMPYRPVSAMACHVSQQELGFQASRAMLMVFMLLGAVGAVGGVRIDAKWEVSEDFDALDKVKVGDPPYDVTLSESKYFPINNESPAIVAQVMVDPKKYGVEKIPEMVILHYVNPVVSFPNVEVIKEGYKKFKFAVALSPWLSETADLFADVVLPVCPMEKYEGPMDAGDMYTDAVALRMPPMEPLFQSRSEIDIYLDLAERAGFLKGKGGYLDVLNGALELGKFALPLNRKPKVEAIFDRWAKSIGEPTGLKYFKKNGVKIIGPFTPSDIYGYAADPPFGGVIHRFYGESLLRYQGEMRAKGAGKIYWQDYTALPTWRQLTMDQSPSKYDLYLISFKQIENHSGHSSFVPLLQELSPKQRLHINPQTAARLGIDEDSEVWVEAHNAVTGKTAKVKVPVMFTEAIRPDTVGMPHHFGLWTHPWAKGQGPTPNSLFQTGEGYVTNTADQSFHVKVQVSKAG